MALGYGPFCCQGGIRGYGNTESKIVFVGIEPAFNEMQSGKPLVGPSGSLLNDVLASFGWKRDWVYCTNLCCTWFDPPSRENLNTCRPRLLDELKLIKPVFLITLGGDPCEELFGQKISKLRGFIQRDVLGIPGCYGMATWHPSAILQSNDKPEEQNNLAAELVRDLKKIRLFYRSEPEPRLAVPPPVGLEPKIYTSVQEAQALLDSLPRDELVVLDIETPTIDKDDKESDPYHQILCVGIGLKGDVQHVFPEALLDKLVFPQDVQWGGWNLYGFDKVALKVRYNIDIPVVHDGMLSSYVRDERTKFGTHKLKHNAREFCLDGATRLLKSDLSWTPIRDVQIGDELIGFDEHAPFNSRRRMRPTVVEEKKVVELERYKITTTKGTLITSPEHMWLAVNPKGRGYRNTQKFTWMKTYNIRPGASMVHYCNTWEEDKSPEGQYLRGFFDGEGWIHNGERNAEVGFGQKDGVVTNYVLSLLRDKGFECGIQRVDETFCQYRFLGASRSAIKFVGSIRPLRFIANKEGTRQLWNGRSAHSSNYRDGVVTVISVEKIEPGELVALQTSTRTFIADGFLSHNCGADFWEEDNVRQDFEHLAKYNGKDVAYNHRLLSFHTRSFDADDSKLYYDLLIPAANLLSESQYTGCTIDNWALLEMSLLLMGEIHETSQELVSMARDYGFPGEINPASTQQVGHLLFDILGIDPTQYSHLTKGGKWSVDKNVLDAINHPWTNLLRKFNNATDTSARYISNPLRQVKFDGKVHPKCWIPGTVTGRLSYSDPPVHQLPHARTIGRLSQVRRIFTVDNDDYVLVEADYQQIELWMMYAFSGDRNLYTDLTQPWSVTGKPDYHSRTCEHGVPCLIHKDKYDPNCKICVKWAFDRDNQKHVNFGIPYGETPFGLMRPPPIGTGLSFQENEKLIKRWHQRNPDFMQWLKSIEYIIRTKGVIKTPFGRKRRLPIILNQKQIRQSINAPIQSVASDYTLSAAIELKPILDQYDTRLLWLTHDAGLWHVPVKHLDKVKSLIREIMEKPRIPGFPSVKVDIKYGKNLFEVSP